MAAFSFGSGFRVKGGCLGVLDWHLYVMTRMTTPAMTLRAAMRTFADDNIGMCNVRARSQHFSCAIFSSHPTMMAAMAPPANGDAADKR